MKNYAIVDSETNVINIIVWDGLTEWTPPEGCIAVAIPEGNCVGIGAFYIDGEFIDFVINTPDIKNKNQNQNQHQSFISENQKLLDKINSGIFT
jgi:hypothetical protein